MNLGTLVGYLGLDTSEWDKGLEQSESGLKSFGKKGAVIAAAAGVAIAAAVTGAVLAGMDIEASNDKLAAQLGLTAPESERIGKLAGTLYANAYGASLAEVNSAVGAVMSSISGMREASSADIEDITAKALDFASAFDIDVTKAANSAGIILKSGLAADAGEAFDLMVAASQKVPAALREDVLDASDEYGQFFATLGYSGEQAFGLLIDASAKGQYGIDKAGDAIKEFTIRSTDMSATSTEAYKAIGLDAQDMANKILAGGDTAQGATQQIIDGLLGIKDPAEQGTAAIALFGTPLEDLSVAEIPAFLQGLQGAGGALENVAGSADRMGQSLNDNASTNLESFKRKATQAFVDVVGGQVLPALNNVASTLSEQFGPAIEAVTGFLSEHETAVKTVGVVLGTAATATLVIVGAVKAWTIAQAALNMVMAANPIGIVVVAIAALVAGLIYAYQNSETFRNIVNGAFDAVKRGVGNAIGFMIDGFRMLLTVWLTVADGIVSGAAKALGWIPGLGPKLKAANQAFDTMKAGILATLDDAAQKAYGFGEKTGSNVAKGATATRQQAFNAGKQVADDMGRGVGSGSGTAYSAGYGVGDNAAQGLINGMRAKQFAVAKQAQILAIETGRAMRSGLQERSPSRVTHAIGVNAAQGLINGMADMRPKILAEMSAMVAMPPVPAINLGGVTGQGGGVNVQPGADRQLSGYGNLLHVETMNLVDGTPRDVAQELMYRARTAGVL